MIHPGLAALEKWEPIECAAGYRARLAAIPDSEIAHHCWRCGWEDADPLQQPQDPEGSLTDADMGAYYTWINQSRLAGADQSRFLVWFEGHDVVCAVSPTLPRGTTSTASVNMRQVLDWMR